MAGGQTAISVKGFAEPGQDVEQPTLAGQPSMATVDEEPEEKPDFTEKLIGIAGRLSRLAQEQVNQKQPVEQRWLDSMRAYHGKYDAAFLAQLTNARQSTAFLKLTRAKTVALEARLYDLMFPTDDRNWDIEATPVPKLKDELKEAEKRATNAAAQANMAEAQGDPRAGEIVAAGNDEAARADGARNEIEVATKAVDLMREEMDDQLIEAKYAANCRKALHDLCQLGSGILKGPVVNEKTRGRWLKSAGSNVYALTQQDDVRPMVRYVNPWNFFPDMSATCIEECEFTFERYLWTKSDLRKGVTTQGFNANAVRELLRDERKNRANSSPSLANLVTLRSITDDSTGQITGRYVGWEYHGPLENEEIVMILSALGQDEEAAEFAAKDDPLEEHRVIVHFCEDAILKIAPYYPLDSGETLYSLANLEDAEGQLFGYGVPTIMADTQVAGNSAWRAALDNAGLSVGPQVLIAKDEIAPADGSWAITPKKVWQRIKAAIPHGPKSIEFFDVPNNMEEIERLIQLCMVFIDLETGIPAPQQGEETRKTDTVGGMAILQNAANIIFRRVVKNCDDGLIAPTMRRLYDWNMQFSTREEIKGDMQIDARGTSVLLVKEVQAQNLMVALSNILGNPNLAPMLKAYPMVQKLFQAMMIKPTDVMVSEDDYKAALQQQAENPQKSPQEIQAEARIEVANIQKQVSEMMGNIQLQVAQLREQTALYDLAAKGEISMEQLRVDLQKTDLNNQSKERLMMAEAAIDRANATEAREHGETPGGSGGNFNEGGAGGGER